MEKPPQLAIFKPAKCHRRLNFPSVSTLSPTAGEGLDTFLVYLQPQCHEQVSNLKQTISSNFFHCERYQIRHGRDVRAGAVSGFEFRVLEAIVCRFVSRLRTSLFNSINFFTRFTMSDELSGCPRPKYHESVEKRSRCKATTEVNCHITPFRAARKASRVYPTIQPKDTSEKVGERRNASCCQPEIVKVNEKDQWLFKRNIVL